MDIVGTAKQNPVLIAASIFSAVALYVLPPPLMDSRFFSFLLACFGGFAGIYLGKVLLEIRGVRNSLILIAAVVVIGTVCAVFYLSMVHSIPTPTIFQIIIEGLLYTVPLICLFILAKLADIKFMA